MIRLATLDDRLELVRMATRFILEPPYTALYEGWTTDGVATLVDRVLANGAIFVCDRVTLASEPHWQQGVPATHELVGMLAIVVVPHPLTDKVYADEVAWWVDPEHRNGTVGPRLLRHMERWCADQGLYMVKMVAPTGSPAGDFYGRSGYRAFETAWVKVLHGPDDGTGDRRGARRRPAGGPEVEENPAAGQHRDAHGHGHGAGPRR